MARALGTLLDVAHGELPIGQLAERLLSSRKEALLLLVKLENQGIVAWDVKARIYRPAPDTLRLRQQGETAAPNPPFRHRQP